MFAVVLFSISYDHDGFLTVALFFVLTNSSTLVNFRRDELTDLLALPEYEEILKDGDYSIQVRTRNVPYVLDVV